jgi:hypothetical protein
MQNRNRVRAAIYRRTSAAPARRALLTAGLGRIELIADISEADLRRLHGVGPKAIERLRGVLAEQGRSFRE